MINRRICKLIGAGRALPGRIRFSKEKTPTEAGASGKVDIEIEFQVPTPRLWPARTSYVERVHGCGFGFFMGLPTVDTQVDTIGSAKQDFRRWRDDQGNHTPTVPLPELNQKHPTRL